MLRGCLLLLLLFAGALFANEWRLRDLGLPWPWAVSGVLALLAMLWLGSLQGLWQAVERRRAGPTARLSDLADGAPVRLSGRLRVDGEPLRAPFSGRAAAYLDYVAYAPSRRSAGDDERTGFRGHAAATVFLDGDGRRIGLDGLPNLSELPHEHFSGAQTLAAAAQFLATTTGWHVNRGPLAVDRGLASALLAGEVPPGGRRDIVDAVALDMLGFEPGQTSVDRLAEALGRAPWRFSEQIIAPGAAVTVDGTWRAATRRIDIGASLRGSAHAIQLGTADAVARRELRTAVVAVLILGALAIGLHLLVHLEKGAKARALVTWWQANSR